MDAAAAVVWVAPAGRQTSAPGRITVVAVALLASSRPFIDTPAAREIANQLSPRTTTCLAAQPPCDVGAGDATPFGRQSTSPGYSTADASAPFAPKRAAVVVPDAVATRNHESPEATVYVAAFAVAQARCPDPASTARGGRDAGQRGGRENSEGKPRARRGRAL